MADENVKEELIRIKPQLISQILPGDTIVLRVKDYCNIEQIEYMVKWTEKHFPDAHVMVLELGMEIEVYRNKEANDAETQ